MRSEKRPSEVIGARGRPRAKLQPFSHRRISQDVPAPRATIAATKPFGPVLVAILALAGVVFRPLGRLVRR